VHDWLTEPGGAERVLEQVLQVYPTADRFTICDYRSECHVLCLSVRIDDLPFVEQKQNFASRLVPYERVELILRSFREMPNQELVVVGDGLYRAQIEAAARPGHRPRNACCLGEGGRRVAHEKAADRFFFAGQRSSHQRRQPLPQSTRSLSPNALRGRCRALQRNGLAQIITPALAKR
jgi:glycosyltransferase involved in cell wall biosynthesis